MALPAPDRRWRFDYGRGLTRRIAVEIEGITHYGNGIGRHQSAKGFVADCEKYEAALLDGWRVFRVPGPWIHDGKQSIWRPQVMDTLKATVGSELMKIQARMQTMRAAS